jgi:hypothetical protein
LDLAGVGLDDLQMGMGMFAVNTLSSIYWIIDPNTYSADSGLNINVPVVYMAQDIMIFMRANPF